MKIKTNRENMVDALEGRRPNRIPFTIYGEFVAETPEWNALYEKGLCYMPRVTIIKEIMDNVECFQEKSVVNGENVVRTTYKTPAGNISKFSINNWVQEYLLKTPLDYRVMTYIIKNTKLMLDNEIYLEKEKVVKDRGLTLVRTTRTPFQRICVDYAGLENFSYHLADEFDEFYELMEALEYQDMQYFKLVAESSAKYIQMPENLTSEQSGPARIQKFHMPVYKKITDILHEAGKKIYAHCDGKLSCIAGLIANSGLDGIESFTLPPEGDMNYEEARNIFADKIIWNNVNLSNYSLPYEELKKTIMDSIPKASVDGSGLLFGVSEDRPANWYKAFSVVLEAIEEYKI